MRSLWLVFLLVSALIAGCSSEAKKQLLEACVKQFYDRGWTDKNTGKLITRETDILIWSNVNGVCGTKVELHLDGYRVQPIIEDGDFRIFLLKDESGLKAYYRKKIQCESNPEKCK